MTDLGGHCLETLLEAFDGASGEQPVCFICYTIKGKGLPLAGHKDNHAGLLTPQQMETFRTSCGLEPDDDWSRTAGLDLDTGQLEAFLGSVPFNARGPRRLSAPQIDVGSLPLPEIRGSMSTQQCRWPRNFCKVSV